MNAKALKLENIFKSFGDAPDGFSEELKEFTLAVGLEYVYNDNLTGFNNFL